MAARRRSRLNQVHDGSSCDVVLRSCPEYRVIWGERPETCRATVVSSALFRRSSDLRRIRYRRGRLEDHYRPCALDVAEFPAAGSGRPAPEP